MITATSAQSHFVSNSCSNIVILARPSRPAMLSGRTLHRATFGATIAPMTSQFARRTGACEQDEIRQGRPALQ